MRPNTTQAASAAVTSPVTLSSPGSPDAAYSFKQVSKGNVFLCNDITGLTVLF